jgi:hypothetical protein
MDSNNIVTRRTILGKGVVAYMGALGLGALARPAATRAKSEKPPTTQSGQITCKVFCDDNGKNCKRCCYDQYGYPMGCTPVESKEPKSPRR